MSKLINALSEKPIIALDFDAVLHKYNGWNGGKLDRPIDGAKEAVEKLLLRGFRVVVFSTRDSEQIRPWLKEFEFPELEICSEKPPFVALLDDRAICFRGRWTNALITELANFRPYWEGNERTL